MSVIGAATVAEEPPFRGGVFMDADIITPDDPSTLETLNFELLITDDVFDDRYREAVPAEFFRFTATYRNGSNVLFDVNTGFYDKTIATGVAYSYAFVLGQQPAILKRNVKRIVVHEEGDGWSANALGLIIIQHGEYDYYKRRRSLEELMFHETVHTSLDRQVEFDAKWKLAQKNDDRFITDYAMSAPWAEDVAESFLAYFAVTMRSDRLSRRTIRRIEGAIPNRLEYFSQKFPKQRLGL